MTEAWRRAVRLLLSSPTEPGAAGALAVVCVTLAWVAALCFVGILLAYVAVLS